MVEPGSGIRRRLYACVQRRVELKEFRVAVRFRITPFIFFATFAVKSKSS